MKLSFLLDKNTTELIVMIKTGYKYDPCLKFVFMSGVSFTIHHTFKYFQSNPNKIIIFLNKMV